MISPSFHFRLVRTISVHFHVVYAVYSTSKGYQNEIISSTQSRFKKINIDKNNLQVTCTKNWEIPVYDMYMLPGWWFECRFRSTGRFAYTALTDQTLKTNTYGPWLLFITVVVVVVIVGVYVFFLIFFYSFVRNQVITTDSRIEGQLHGKKQVITTDRRFHGLLRQKPGGHQTVDLRISYVRNQLITANSRFHGQLQQKTGDHHRQ